MFDRPTLGMGLRWERMEAICERARGSLDLRKRKKKNCDRQVKVDALERGGLGRQRVGDRVP